MKLLHKLALTIENGNDTSIEKTSRRQWLKQLGIAGASGAFLVACGSDEKDSQRNSESQSSDQSSASSSSSDLVNDGGLLNAALALEHEAIAIYTAAAGLPVMNTDAAAPVLAIAGSFLAHHKEHRQTLISAISDMKKKDKKVASPVEANDAAEYVPDEVVKKIEGDLIQVVRLASLKEMEASQAYLSLISSFKDGNLAQVSGMLGGDEAGHYGVLRAALGVILKDEDISNYQDIIPASLPAGWNQTF